MRLVGPILRAITIPSGASGTRAVAKLAVVFIVIVITFSAGFLAVMHWEGQQHSVAAAIYWTVVTMSTLGFGDIVFTSDLGRLYSLIVLGAGAVLILVILPFTFIQLVYVPWRAATRQAQAPRSLPATITDHLLVTGHGEVEEVLIRRARAAGMPYAILVDDIDRALALHDNGHAVMVGDLDDPETYRSARAEHAALIFSARNDQANTNVAFTVRQVTERPLLVVTANDPDSVDVLELAGADHVLQLGQLLGNALARRILSRTRGCQIIAHFEHVVIAEMIAAGTDLTGRLLSDIDLRERHRLSVVGIWDRGTLQQPSGDIRIADTSILVLAGHADDVAAYASATADASDKGTPGHAESADQDRPRAPVVIIGGGRVGRAAADTVQQSGRTCRIVEKDPSRQRNGFDYVIGDAADRSKLSDAGIDDASAVLITTHDDDINIFLTLYARRLRNDALVLGRVAHERNLSTMYRAGADFVLSYASTGATEVWNRMRSESATLITEGLVAFRQTVPPKLVGRRLAELDLQATTGCTVVAVLTDAETSSYPDPHTPLTQGARLVLIGPEDAEDRFMRRFVARRRITLTRRRRG
ncbi:MAG: NAD-binding protein [Nitriliruptoraceae bacterium]